MPRHRHRSVGERTSRFLSLVLRHEPARIGIVLDAQGWVGVDRFLAALAAHGRPMTRAELERVVATNDKRRFAFDESGTRIRASQGHSLKVDLGYVPVTPPETLYHGTVARFLPGIRVEGLRAMNRHHVHLSGDFETATRVGQRRGRPVVLKVRAGAMAAAGHLFYRSQNGVWLTERVPPEYLEEGGEVPLAGVSNSAPA